MTDSKREQELLLTLTRAIESSVGRRSAEITLDTYLRKDLNLSSIEMMLFGSQVEKELGIDFEFRNLWLTVNPSGTARRLDLQIRQIVEYLLR